MLVTMVANFTVEYKTQPVFADGVAALVPGKNTLAVHCSQTTGGQYIDVGLVTVEAAPAATGGADIDVLVLPADAAEAFLADPLGRNAKQHEMVKKFRPKLKQLLDRCGSDEEKLSFGELERRLGDADKTRPTPLASAYIWYEESNQAGASHVWRRGNPRD